MIVIGRRIEHISSIFLNRLTMDTHMNLALLYVLGRVSEVAPVLRTYLTEWFLQRRHLLSPRFYTCNRHFMIQLIWKLEKWPFGSFLVAGALRTFAIIFIEIHFFVPFGRRSRGNVLFVFGDKVLSRWVNKALWRHWRRNSVLWNRRIQIVLTII